MKALTSSFLIAALTLAGTGAAMAATTYSDSAARVMPGIAACNSMGDKADDWTTVYLEDHLKADGIKYTEISTFSDCFRVTVLNDDGSTSIQLYDPDSSSRVR